MRGERLFGTDGIRGKVLNQDSNMRIFASPQTVSLTVVGGNEFISRLEPT